MNPIKMIRQLGKALRGGATFSQVFFGVFIGFAIGMMPGVSLTMLILFALLLLLNINGGVAALALITGKVLCLLLAPFTFEIGYFLIHSLGFSGLVTALGDTPVLALLDLHVYCLIGGLPLSVVLGGILAYCMASFFVKFQTATSQAASDNARYQKMMGNKAVRFLLWLAFGGKQKKAGENEEENKNSEGLILKGRIIAGAVALALVCIVSYFYLDALARVGIKSGIEAMTGAEVNVSSATLSPLSGRLVVEGIEVTDPALPSHNQFEAEIITADIDVAALLTRRLVADEIICSGVKNGAERSTAGEVYVEVSAKQPPAELGKDATPLERVKTYYEKIKEIREQVKEINDYLDSNDPAAGSPTADGKTDQATAKERLLAEARLRGYLSLSAKDALSKQPAWWIRLLAVKKLEVNQALPSMMVEAKNLSSAPSLLEEKRSITVKPDEEAIAALKKEAGSKIGNLVREKLGDKVGDDIKDKAGAIGSKLKGFFKR